MIFLIISIIIIVIINIIIRNLIDLWAAAAPAEFSCSGMIGARKSRWRFCQHIG